MPGCLSQDNRNDASTNDQQSSVAILIEHLRQKLTTVSNDDFNLIESSLIAYDKNLNKSIKNELNEKLVEINQLKTKQIDITSQLITYADEYYRLFDEKIVELNNEASQKDQWLSEKDHSIGQLNNKLTVSESKLNEMRAKVNALENTIRKYRNESSLIAQLETDLDVKIIEEQVVDRTVIKQQHHENDFDSMYKESLLQIDNLKKKYDKLKAKARMFKERLKKYENQNQDESMIDNSTTN